MRPHRLFATIILLLALLVPAWLQAGEGRTYLGQGWFNKVYRNDGEATVTKVPKRRIAGQLDGTSPVRTVSQNARRLMSRRTCWGINVLRKGGLNVPKTQVGADGVTLVQDYVPLDKKTVSLGQLPWRLKLKALRIVGRQLLSAHRLLRASANGSVESQVSIDPHPRNFCFKLRDGKIAETIWVDPVVPVPPKVFNRLLAASAAHVAAGWTPRKVWGTADISLKR